MYPTIITDICKIGISSVGNPSLLYRPFLSFNLRNGCFYFIHLLSPPPVFFEIALRTPTVCDILKLHTFFTNRKE